MRKLRYFGAAILFALLANTELYAQRLLKADITGFLKDIPPVSKDLDELYQLSQDRSEQAAYEQLKTWVAEIHDETILKKMDAKRQNGMSFAVQYEDERLRLGIRPLMGITAVNKISTFSALSKELVKRLMELERAFDWQRYYKIKDDARKKQWSYDAGWEAKRDQLMAKIPEVKTEHGAMKDPEKQQEISKRLAKEKGEASLVLFRQQVDEWTILYKKYFEGALQVQELLEKSNYCESLPVNERKLVSTIAADVQARSLEAMEKMVFEGSVLIFRGAELYNQREIYKSYFGD